MFSERSILMTSNNHDTLVYRLAQMLVKLNQGERLDPSVLADEFGVNLRTIQRDLNARFAYLPLQKTDGRYHLDPTFLGKLSTKDIERFAGLAGICGLFPSLNDDFLRDIFDTRVQATLLVKGVDIAIKCHHTCPQFISVFKRPRFGTESDLIVQSIHH